MDPQGSTQTQNYPPAFERAMARLLGDEGGYVDNPADPGGETKFGITKREYPNLDIAALTPAAAAAIYYRDWWQRYGYGELPGPIAVKLFDLAVNIGPDHAARCMQRALRACGRRVTEDGALGRAAAVSVSWWPALPRRTPSRSLRPRNRRRRTQPGGCSRQHDPLVEGTLS